MSRLIINPCEGCKAYKSILEIGVDYLLEGNKSGYENLREETEKLIREREGIGNLSQACDNCEEGADIYSSTLLDNVKGCLEKIKEFYQKERIFSKEDSNLVRKILLEMINKEGISRSKSRIEAGLKKGNTSLSWGLRNLFLKDFRLY